MNVPEWIYVGDIVNQLEMELIIGNGSAAAGHRLIEDIAGAYRKRGESIPSLRRASTTRSALLARSIRRSCRPWKRRLPTACIRNFST